MQMGRKFVTAGEGEEDRVPPQTQKSPLMAGSEMKSPARGGAASSVCQKRSYHAIGIVGRGFPAALAHSEKNESISELLSHSTIWSTSCRIVLITF